MQASLPMEAYGLSRSTVAGQMGTGVEFNDIERIREMFWMISSVVRTARLALEHPIRYTG